MLKKIYELAKRMEPESIRYLSEMIAIPSFSTKEQDIVSYLRHEMEKAAFDEIRVDGLGSIIGRIGNGPRIIAFDAHIDTVLAGDLELWTNNPFTPIVKDGMIFGRGSSDQKGGMAAMMTAARIIKELNLQTNFTLLFTGTVMEEDCDGLCWKHLISEEKIRPELVIITEPTNLNIYRGQRGRMEIVVKIKGLSCHGSAPERGDNAIYKISRIALEIEKLNAKLTIDPFLGKGTVTVTQIFFTSPSQCAVPDSATIQLDRRLTLGETENSALEEIRKCCINAGYPEAIVSLLHYKEISYTGLEFPSRKYYPAWILPEQSKYLKTAVEAYQLLLGKEPLVDKWTFSTNGVTISGVYEIPCLGLGPGFEEQAHAPNEHCPIDHLTKAAAFYAAYLHQLDNV